MCQYLTHCINANCNVYYLPLCLICHLLTMQAASLHLAPVGNSHGLSWQEPILMGICAHSHLIGA